ncbi:MAG: hypothetical protein LBG24_01415 [Treponema sp.]|jgi:hypothetical protein|nr:hypothetical protein [Treponema sp.]
MATLRIYCTNCSNTLVVDEVTEGPNTETYIVGCNKCHKADSGGEIQSSTYPKAGNPDTSVYRA